MPQVQTEFVGSDVTPGLAVGNPPALTFANTELPSYCGKVAAFSARKQSSYFNDRSIAEFGMPSRTSPCMIPMPPSNGTHHLTTFCNHVSHVVELRAKKKMVWIDAESDIARMAYVHTVRNRASMHLKRNAMCVCETFCVSVPYKSISTVIGTEPNPASRFGDWDVLFLERRSFH